MRVDCTYGRPLEVSACGSCGFTPYHVPVMPVFLCVAYIGTPSHSCLVFVTQNLSAY
jgi:hypothetical protein